MRFRESQGVQGNFWEVSKSFTGVFKGAQGRFCESKVVSRVFQRILGGLQGISRGTMWYQGRNWNSQERFNGVRGGIWPLQEVSGAFQKFQWGFRDVSARLRAILVGFWSC